MNKRCVGLLFRKHKSMLARPRGVLSLRRSVFAMYLPPRPTAHLIRRQYSAFALELEFDDERLMPQPLHALDLDFEPESTSPFNTAPSMAPNSPGTRDPTPPVSRPKIRKPEGESGRSEPRGYNLKTTLNWEEGLYEKVLVRTVASYRIAHHSLVSQSAVESLANKHLPAKVSFMKQPAAQLSVVYAEVRCIALPASFFFTEQPTGGKDVSHLR